MAEEGIKIPRPPEIPKIGVNTNRFGRGRIKPITQKSKPPHQERFKVTTATNVAPGLKQRI